MHIVVEVLGKPAELPGSESERKVDARKPTE